MGKSYNDPVKKLAREKQRDFIARHLSYKRPEQIRVLCLPGAEQEGEEALEVREVYDPLGIPRQNITGLEIDKGRYERLQRASLGIKLANSSDIDYLERAKGEYGTWDVISLDYTSFITTERLYAINLIAADGLLGNRGVLVTNFMGRREHANSQSMLQQSYAFMKYPLPFPKSRKEIVGLIRDIYDFRNTFDLSEQRSDTLRQLIIRTMHNGRLNLYIDFYRLILGPTFDDRLNMILKDPEIIENILSRKCGRNDIEKLAYSVSIRNYWKFEALAQLSKIPELAKDLFLTLGERSYFVEDAEPYNYISNTNTPMLFDIFYFDRKEQELRASEDFFVIHGRENEQEIRFLPFESEGKRVRKAKRAVEAIARGNVSIMQFEEKERKFLGSSFVPSRRKESISKGKMHIRRRRHNCR